MAAAGFSRRGRGDCQASKGLSGEDCGKHFRGLAEVGPEARAHACCVKEGATLEAERTVTKRAPDFSANLRARILLVRRPGEAHQIVSAAEFLGPGGTHRLFELGSGRRPGRFLETDHQRLPLERPEVARHPVVATHVSVARQQHAAALGPVQQWQRQL